MKFTYKVNFEQISFVHTGCGTTLTIWTNDFAAADIIIVLFFHRNGL
jgi:hypothetical protein